MTGERSPEWAALPLRSLLFVPGSESRKLEKARGFGADAIVLDLEDAVAVSAKDDARALVRAALPSYRTRVIGVRVNGFDTGLLEEDVRAVFVRGLDCLVVPKVEAPGDLVAVHALLTELERKINRDPVRLLATVETAKGLARAEEIALAAPERLVTLIFGLADFSRDLGIDPTPSGDELLYARSRVVVAARAAGLRAPIDGPYLELADPGGLADDSRRSRRLGFAGRVVLHPGQVEPVQRAYSELTSGDIEACRRQVEAFEHAEAHGRASVQVDGRFVDYPLYHRAKQKLLLHETLQGRVPA